MGCYEDGRPEDVHAEGDPGRLAGDEGLHGKRPDRRSFGGAAVVVQRR
jgi:hypothetical protein